MTAEERSLAGRRTWFLDAILLFVLTAALIWPLFKLKYSDNWSSIESTFIADARFLTENWPYPRWQPLWYCGTRFDYIYPPALRYGTAALMKLYPPLVAARAYHLYTAVLYCLGIAGVYVLMRTGGGSRAAGWMAAVAVAVCAPAFLLVEPLRIDAPLLEPQRLHVLLVYGEGPHITALSLLGFALALSLRALVTGSSRSIAAAAASTALVVSHNFYGATALAVFFPILVWSYWITHRNHRILLRAAVIAALAYGLCAFWLVPGYVRITIRNLQYVAEKGSTWSLWVAAAAGVLFLAASGWTSKGRPERAWAVFLSGSLLFFALHVLGFLYFDLRVTGDPRRLVPELDLVLVLCFTEAVRRLWTAAPGSPLALHRGIAVAAVAAAFYLPVVQFLPNAWRLYRPELGFRDRIEYRITDWIAKNRPNSRSFTHGSIRFWFNAWHDLAQLGGGSEQGMLNEQTTYASWNIGHGDDAERALLYLKALGVDLVVAADQSSEEWYHDFVHPRIFDNVLPVIFDDQKGNRIYEVPRRHRSLGRVVETMPLETLPPISKYSSNAELAAFVDLVENGPEVSVETRWLNSEELAIDTRLNTGQSLLVFETYDPNWRAWVGERELRVSPTNMGLLRVDAPAGSHRILLKFYQPVENQAGWVVSILAFAVGVLLAVRSKHL